jgi:subtilisin family serine protease
MRHLLAVVAAALVLAPPASAASLVVGVEPGASRADVAAAVAARTGGTLVEDLGPLQALVFDVSGRGLGAAALPGVAYVERPGATPRSLAFTPNDPLLPSQWYLRAVRAFDFWPERPDRPPVLVAVVDSGLDGGHPEFAGRVAGARSFVGSPALVDRGGHGTMVAGEIAAAVDNGRGIAGAGVPVRLLVAKVIDDTGDAPLLAEVRAIRWAVNRGAKVINISLGGPRNPRNLRRDTYSRLEHAAIDYATRRGVVVVAAAGNCTTVACPEPYASWPAALPHVLGVSAVGPGGESPEFSNRDRVYNDLAAPGTDILTTYPRRLSARLCPYPGYTACAREISRRSPSGTSFSAPLVAAAAALLLGERDALGLGPLHSSQVTAILTRSAVDVGQPGRDRASGNGVLDVNAALAALAGEVPPRDRFEANDDAGARAYPLPGSARTVDATLDRWDDQRDVYRVGLRRGQRLTVTLDGPAGGESNLFVWRPGTESLAAAGRLARLAASAQPGSAEGLRIRARRSGAYFVEVRLAGGASGAYRLTLTRG